MSTPTPNADYEFPSCTKSPVLLIPSLDYELMYWTGENTIEVGRWLSRYWCNYTVREGQLRILRTRGPLAAGRLCLVIRPGNYIILACQGMVAYHMTATPDVERVRAHFRV